MTRRPLPRVVAVMLTMAAMAAHGEVTVFGHDGSDRNNLGQADQHAITTSDCDNCSFGVDGGNDLGNGLKAIYRLEWGSAGDRGSSLDRWLGVGGDFGEVKVGTLSTRYKSAGVIPDAMYRASSLNASGMPSVQAGYKADSGSVNPDDGLGLSYENAGVLIFADYISGNTGSDDTAYKVGAKFATDNFAVFGQYRIDTGVTSRQLTDTSSDNTNIWFLGGSLSLGSTSIYASYGKADDNVNAGFLPVYDVWEVVGVRSVGKLTSIYAGYSGTGCADRNPDLCRETGTEGVDDDKFSLGIRHNF